MMIQMRDKTEKPVPPSAPGGGLTCEEFQDQMAGLMGSNIRSHAHLQTCVRCSRLLDDLEYIGEIAKGLLPSHEPSDKVWQRIVGSLHEPSEQDGKSNGLPPISKG
jgi:hypothetical protein